MSYKAVARAAATHWQTILADGLNQVEGNRQVSNLSFLQATLALLLRPLPGPSPRPNAAMSALAPRLLSDLTRPARSLVRVPRPALHTRPAREELSTLEKAVGLAASFVCLLVPGGWILSHLENYKKKE
ncbi:cytochrome c oxidase subunit 8A, mitochondrial-like [Trichosurus vulpecula]|uniref:cytochrome c oxidase subunit 8A, mitochondrial-like n=1 Tax=Trichosurus vulpecula TaxID=9337 RepID=UPI00186B36D1|nr:cytochrome c oxidase subunit 8A, mitochondrial-like [Trichosurus vulpecula]